MNVVKALLVAVAVAALVVVDVDVREQESHGAATATVSPERRIYNVLEQIGLSLSLDSSLFLFYHHHCAVAGLLSDQRCPPYLERPPPA